MSDERRARFEGGRSLVRHARIGDRGHGRRDRNRLRDVPQRRRD